MALGLCTSIAGVGRGVEDIFSVEKGDARQLCYSGLDCRAGCFAMENGADIHKARATSSF